MEVHIIEAENRSLYGQLLEDNFRRRAEIFIDEMRWSALHRVNGRETDQFDTPDATYVLAVEFGRLLGGIRLHCSLTPTLISEVFPHAAPLAERAADVLEGTRLYIVPERRTEHPNKVSGVLHWAAWTHAHHRGARAIQLLTHAAFVPHLMRSGLKPKPLGLPTSHDDMVLQAVSTEVSPDVLTAMLAFYDIEPVPLLRDGSTIVGRSAA